jgi:hypothetical protein
MAFGLIGIWLKGAGWGGGGGNREGLRGRDKGLGREGVVHACFRTLFIGSIKFTLQRFICLTPLCHL